jgi:CRISPR/Cas system-associated exonuclease Cas4 (RecB family)
VSTFSNANPFGFEEKPQAAAWITWLSEPLAEAGACLLPLHQQSRLVVPKDDDGGAFGDWATKHAALVETIAATLQGQGRAVEIERSIAVASRSGVEVCGQMDVFAPEASPMKALVVDAKTGKARSKHRAQVLVYMALLQASPDFETTVPPDGGLVYGDGNKVVIPGAEADGPFKKRLAALLEVVASDGPAPEPIPGSACRFCRLQEWCPSSSSGRPKPPAISEF